MNKFRDSFHRFLNFEYWPFWIFYFPVFLLWPLFSLRGKSVLFFTAANPCIPQGGCFGESKNAILNMISEKFLPKTYFVDTALNQERFQDWLSFHRLSFPLVAKPDVGERGDNIRILNNFEDVVLYKRELARPFLLQEYLDSSFEVGVMVIRDPVSDKVTVTSVVSKVFLNVTGDGKSTLEELVMMQPRARFQWKRLSPGMNAKLIPAPGECIILEKIGNHKRGTTFINSNHLITPEVQKVFSDIVKSINGFYIGRFDLKTPDEKSFSSGAGIKIMELNGAFSEPGHIYDPEGKLIAAWRDLVVNWWALASISGANQARGHQATSFMNFARLYYDYKRLPSIEAV